MIACQDPSASEAPHPEAGILLMARIGRSDCSRIPLPGQVQAVLSSDEETTQLGSSSREHLSSILQGLLTQVCLT